MAFLILMSGAKLLASLISYSVSNVSTDLCVDSRNHTNRQDLGKSSIIDPYREMEAGVTWRFFSFKHSDALNLVVNSALFDIPACLYEAHEWPDTRPSTWKDENHMSKACAF